MSVGGGSRLGGGFGTRGTGSQRFGGGTARGTMTGGSSGMNTTGASRYGGGFGTRGVGQRRFASTRAASRPSAMPSRTGAGRFGGATPDTRGNTGRSSPGSRYPGQYNNPAQPRGGSPLGTRGSVYGGNRQYLGMSNSRYGRNSWNSSLRTRGI